MFKELSRIFGSPARLKVLKFFALQSGVRISASEAALQLGMSRAKVETELRVLSKVGVLQRRGQGKKVTYMFPGTHPYSEAIRIFLESTTVPDDKAVAGAFRGVSGITLIAATGTLMQDPRPSLDLLIVSRRPKNPDIARAVRKLETGTALSLRYAVLETGEYKNRLETRDRLLRDVFDFSYRVILGRV
jgi:DNA-binding transcriptional ArsR family regulator